jgi:hypothetical protein
MAKPANPFEWLDALFPDDKKDADFHCDDCNADNGLVRFACSCGFNLQSCAKCLGDRKSEVLSALGEHAGECEKGRHLLRAMTL